LKVIGLKSFSRNTSSFSIATNFRYFFQAFDTPPSTVNRAGTSPSPAPTAKFRPEFSESGGTAPTAPTWTSARRATWRKSTTRHTFSGGSIELRKPAVNHLPHLFENQTWPAAQTEGGGSQKRIVSFVQITRVP
jgi:hypothetical protein